MLNQPLVVAGTQSVRAARANTARFSTLSIGLLFIWAAFTSLDVHAQQYVENDLAEYVYSVEAPAGPWMTGDTVTFTVTLGDEETPAEHVVGIRLDLTLDAAAIVPNDVGISVASSWCFDAPNLYTDVDVAGSPTVLTLLLRSADYTSQSGEGHLFTFRLIADDDNLPSGAMIDNKGGVVIIENVDARLANIAPTVAALPAETVTTAPKQQLHCFPNPVQAWTQVPLRMEADMQAWLVAPDGRSHLLTTRPLGERAELDLRAYPPGVYQLVILQAGAVIFQDRLLKI
jgi:hypothetical protein